MSGQMDSCFGCKDLLFYPDEKVIGTWNGEPNTRFDVLDFDEHSGAYEASQEIPDGYLVYCLNCAPCECGDHERFAPHRAVEIDKQNNTP